MKPRQKKTPSDYPQFAFRLTASEKEWLQRELQIVEDLKNKRLEPGAPMIRRNDIALEALRIGLRELRKKI